MDPKKYLFQKDNTLADFQTFEKDDEAEDKLKKNRKKIGELQDVMYAHNQYSILICLQGMDTCGKDSLVKEVFKNVNDNGVNIHSFKTPSEEERSHDYLWRHYLKLPERGNIGVFNRTHYENVLVTRVHPEFILGENIPGMDSVEKITDDFYRQRMEQINHFEEHLTQNGTVILKFFLYMSKDEQKDRLMRRLELEEKNWKFSAGDLKERKLWDKYMACYEDMLIHTSTNFAPWYVIPADDKETARYFVAKIIKEKMESLPLHYPQLSDLEKNNIKNYMEELKNS